MLQQYSLSIVFSNTLQAPSQFMTGNISNWRHIFSRPASRKINYIHATLNSIASNSCWAHELLRISASTYCSSTYIHTHAYTACFFLILCSRKNFIEKIYTHLVYDVHPDDKWLLVYNAITHIYKTRHLSMSCSNFHWVNIFCVMFNKHLFHSRCFFACFAFDEFFKKAILEIEREPEWKKVVLKQQRVHNKHANNLSFPQHLSHCISHTAIYFYFFLQSSLLRAIKKMMSDAVEYIFH